LQKLGLNIFGGLNAQQAEVVRENDCPLLILAGAGSGKTLTVASKIAYLVESGVASERILALAFNQKAAEELKSRVLGMLQGCEDLSISTFHSFCNQVIEENILSTKLNANFRVITDTAQLVYLTKNINSFGIEYLEFNHEPYTLAEEMKKFISRCKDEFVTPQDLQLYIQQQETTNPDAETQEELNNLKDIVKIYHAYETYKLQNNMLDFGDMLCTVYSLLSNKPLILKKYQDRFQFIIVDEFQDTNYIQLQIVNLMAQQHGHIMVVGDDDQSIYRFRGAHLTNIAEFKKMFPNCTQKTLEQNYRSTQKIVATANTLIENNPQRTPKQLFTHNPPGDNIQIVENPTDTDQANYILQTTKELLKKYLPQDIAILCRRKTTADPIIKLFRKHNIPFNFTGDTGFFEEPIIKDITSYLKVISNPLENNPELIRILSRPNYAITPMDICKFTHYADKKKLTLYETLDHLDNIEVNKPKFQHVKQTLTNILNTKKRHRTLDLIHNLLFEQEFYKYELALKNNHNMQLLNHFYTLTEEFNTLYPDKDIEDLNDYLTIAANFEQQNKNDIKQTITISTIHGVKGMQYPAVIIPDLNERKLPTTHQKDKFTLPKQLQKGIQPPYDDKELHTQEERRLLYVAISRAKEKLILTYAKHHGENKTETKPSRFLQEINYQQNPNITHQQQPQQQTTPQTTTSNPTPMANNQTQTELLQNIIANLTTQQYNTAIENILLLAKTTNENINIQTEIINKIKEPSYTTLKQPPKKPLTVPPGHIFSVSQFVSYKKCPQLYQYRHVMKIPEKPRYYFDFGSTIHSITEQLTKMQKENQPTNENIANELLAKFWNPKGYKTKIDEQKDYTEAKRILKIFMEEQNKTQTQIIDIERWFETAIGNIRIRGRIDRIDKDQTGLTVIDYKTSKKATPLNELKKDMQLIIYALAVRDIYGNQTTLRVGDWFLRPNQKIFFTPEKQDIENIQIEIQEISKKINSATFDPKKNSWECRDCDYKCLCD